MRQLDKSGMCYSQMAITIVQGPYFPVPPILESGVEKMWFGLGEEFSRRGHAVTHVSRRFSGLPDEGMLKGVRHIRVASRDAPKSKLLYRAYDLLYSLRAMRVLPIGADILVTNCMWLPLLIRNAKRGRLYVHVARFPKRQMFLYQHAARIQTVSSVVGQAIQKGINGTKCKTTVISPFVSNVPSGSPPPSFQRRNSEILYVGRIHPEKGVHLLVEAFEKLAVLDARLILVGSHEFRHGGGGGDYLAELKRRAGNKLSQIHFAGLVEQGSLNSFFENSKVLVYPSLAERGESFGVVPLEGMICGCPAIVSDLACFRDYLVAGQNGYVFDHRTRDPSTELLKAIKAVLSDESSRLRVAQAGYKTAQLYSIETIASKYLEDFAEIVTSSS